MQKLTTFTLRDNYINLLIIEINQDNKIDVVFSEETKTFGYTNGIIKDRDALIADIKKLSRNANEFWDKNSFFAIGIDNTNLTLIKNQTSLIIPISNYKIDKNIKNEMIKKKEQVILEKGDIIYKGIQSYEFQKINYLDCENINLSVGNKIYFNLNFIIIKKFFKKNLIQIFKEARVDIENDDIYSSDLCQIPILTNKIQRNSSCLVLEIGEKNTGLTLIAKDQLLHFTNYNFNLSDDLNEEIAIRLRVPIYDADRIKTNIELVKKDYQKIVQSIIENKVKQLLKKVSIDLTKLEYNRIPGGITISGFGSRIDKITEMAKENLHSHAETSQIKCSFGETGLINNNFSGAYGISIFCFNKQRKEKEMSIISNVSSSVKKFFVHCKELIE